MMNPSSCRIWGLGALNHSFCTFERGPTPLIPEMIFSKKYHDQLDTRFWKRSYASKNAEKMKFRFLKPAETLEFSDFHQLFDEVFDFRWL